MAIVMKQALISQDIWTIPTPETDIYQLQVKDFTKWVRKQVRLFGRKADICNQQYSAVEMWLQALGIATSFVCGGEVKVDGVYLYSDFQSSGYYMFNEEGMMETKAGRWMDICDLENQESYLVAR